jgi:predicted enzyme related to lactoylglutathione lyase
MPAVSGILFAKDARKVAQFYAEVLGADVSAEAEHHTALEVQGFRLVIHRIPGEYAKLVDVRNPPVRREMGPIRLDFGVADVVEARKLAKNHGGQIDDQPPPWAGTTNFFLGSDPEGNVFGVSDANP